MDLTRFKIGSAPASDGCVFEVGNLRISVLDDCILRVEEGSFTDLRTQIVYCRNFSKPTFISQIYDDKVVVVTNKCKFIVRVRDGLTGVENDGKVVYPSNRKNLGGTARTLDGTFGLLAGWKGNKEKRDGFFVKRIRKGIFAENGVVELDDSASCLLSEDGGVKSRDGGSDKYILAFGDDYLDGLKKFFELTGFPPLLPKYALSNWWSRYHAYTDKEYLALMDEFSLRGIPFTVAAVDMDWHIVKNVPKDAEFYSQQGAGWTGYTFEKSLFPDPAAFLRALKDRDLAVTMNLHPRDGVRYFEEQYPAMATAMGIDPKSGHTVAFDLTDKKFLQAYFDILHHPYEKMGVDFWWIDWQQGTKSAVRGLDPLWLLNHYHYLDNCRDGRTGLILSRYAGLGSHRYPVGFSGDTFVTWSSLRFQPYFTALASNAGYTWWSHDIGGHMFGHGDQKLYLRWLQFGVFSPINRLHSSNKALSKEPWLYKKVEKEAIDFLRLRHRLLPYLYTACVKTHEQGVPLVSPVYYYDKDPRSYSRKYRNQYYFGEQMLVSPVTRKSDKVKVWLPKGKWTGFFDGRTYEGGEEFVYRCPLDAYPVFVKDGGIVPLLDGGYSNSRDFGALEVRVYPQEREMSEFVLRDVCGKVKFELKRDANGYVFTAQAEDMPLPDIKLVVGVAGYKAIESCIAEGVFRARIVAIG